MKAFRRLSLTAAITITAIAATACAPMGDIVGADAPEPGAPYCMVDRDDSAHLTVAGPAGGWITIDAEGYKALTRVTADDYGSEVAPDAEPFDGILYNVPGGDLIAVDGEVCETT